MSYRKQTLDAISTLLSYPTETYVESAELLYVILQTELPNAAESIAAFGEFAEPLSLDELEEIYARTFDINPACALEVGWHLFGEEYARGMFLVRLRGEMRNRGLEESGELPDHISHVLGLVAAMSDDDARSLVRSCVQPAVEKMRSALERAESSYQHVLRCLSLVLEHEFGSLPASGQDEDTSTDRLVTPRGDPLRDFPMPRGQNEFVELVPLRMNFHGSPETPARANIQEISQVVARDDSDTRCQTSGQRRET